jgi:3-hydroxyisobutyrate dehydrogenase-like beta-hydroxyacid dehydrogenase
MSIKRVGFLGLGLMGSRMAACLKRRGFEVIGWNRTPKAIDGIARAQTPGELAEQVDAFCTCVADPPALQSIASQLLAAARPGQLFVDFSTVSVGLSQSLGARCAEKGLDFADAPVTGSKIGAEKGTLVIMTGCSEATLERARPLFMGVGEKVIHCGPVGAGTQVKLAGNLIIAAMLESLSEGMLTVSKAGVDPRKVLEVIEASAFRSPYFQAKGNAMLARDFSQTFSIDLMHKDLELFLAEAVKHKVPAPAAAALRETYNVARSSGKGDLDICGVITALEDICRHTLR